jgi:hypothetical protein
VRARGAVALTAALIAAPVLCHAHAVLVNSAPAARATLSYPPTRVDLWFSERLEPAWSTASVWSASGARVDPQGAVVSPDDAKRLSVPLNPLPPGTYVVRFRVLSVDGHVVESSFPFTVKPKP